MTVFGNAKFELDKWNSNMKELENIPRDIPLDITYAEEELGTNLPRLKILGVA